MDKISTEISINGPISSTLTPTEKRALSEVIPNTKRSGGNYGSLAKSQIQPTFYICHKVESDDTMQRLALKYSINIQAIKRTNKLWSDAELSLLENVFIPVNSSQLTTLRTLYPTLSVVQNPSPTPNRGRKSSANAVANNETASFIRTSDSTASLSAATTNYPSYQDYFSKIDQQIRTSKHSLQSFNIPNQYSKFHSNGKSSSSHLSNDNHSNETNCSQTGRVTFWNHNERHKGVHHLSDNSAFVNITTQNSREKHVSAALERIQREKDNSDEL